MRIKEIRAQQDIQQKELAALLGIAANTLSQYETGKREPDIKTLVGIADALNVSVDDLLGRDANKKDPATMKDSEVIQEIIGLLSGFSEQKVQLAVAYLRYLSNAEDM